MSRTGKTHLIGGGIGPLAIAVSLLGEGGMPGMGLELSDTTSIRAARRAVDERLGITRAAPPITPHDRAFRTRFRALVKAFAGS